MLPSEEVVEKFAPCQGSVMMQSEANRRMLARYCNDLPEDSLIVELGTYQGYTTCLLAAASPDSAHVYTIDHGGVLKFGHEWWNPSKTSSERREMAQYLENEYRSLYRQGLEERFQDFGYHDKITFLFGSSHHEDWIATPKWPPGVEIDLLLVDGDHRYHAVMADLIRWAPKVKVGGHMFCHDYGYQINPVMAAVQDYFRAYPEWDVVSVDSQMLACRRRAPWDS